MIIELKDRAGNYLFDVDCTYTPKEWENQVEEECEINDITVTIHNEMTYDDATESIMDIIKWADKLDDVHYMCLEYIHENKR